MPKNILHVIAASLFLLTLPACNTDCDHATQYPLQNLSSYLSYTGHDTLRFLHNNTDTQVFIGEGLNYFWVRKPAFDDTQCPEDHQSVSIQFRNQQNGNTLKIEYVYDRNLFLEAGIDNDKTDYKFYLQGEGVWITRKIYDPGPTIINGVDYSKVAYYSNQADTSRYIMYRRPYDGGFGGIVKVKQLGDILTILP